MDWTRPTTQLLGRFQPWHKGHTELFKRALSKTGQVVILLREQDGSDKNPYTFEDRSRYCISALEAEGFTYDKDFIIVRVPNVTHITYGRDVGYKIEQETLDSQIESISATKIREERMRQSGLYMWDEHDS